MRLDISLYVLAIVFFMISLLSVVLLEGTMQTIWLIATVILGIVSLCLGFVQKPKNAVSGLPAPPATPVQPTENLPPPPEPETPAPTLTTPPIENPPQTASEPITTATVVSQTETIPVQVPQEEPKMPAQIEPVTATETKMLEPINVEVPQEVAAAGSVGSPLMQVSGIGEKRAAQLNALGIKTVDDLANASTQEVAESLKVSPKIVSKWVSGAKKLNKK